MARPTRFVRRFLATEAAGGVVLLVAAVVSLLLANSPWHAGWESLWETGATVEVGRWSISEDLRHWVNDGLMAVFFFVVGLEIKRELVLGELRDRRAAAIPALAALGGMVVPALVFLLFTAGTAGSRGWGIPMATDIAFAVGVLAVLGRRVPASLKLFLLTLAIVDDIGAILVIAVFYSAGIEPLALLVAAALLVGVVLVHRAGVHVAAVHLSLGVAVWVAVFQSGVHATIAGVALGLVTPARRADELEHDLHPVSSFLVIPVFALANAGVRIEGDALGAAGAGRLVAGVALGLVVGKVLGITGATWLAVRLGIGRLPSGARWPQVVGVAAVAGIGFTVSLFVAGLAYDDPQLVAAAKIGILGGSLVAALAGSGILLAVHRRR